MSHSVFPIPKQTIGSISAGDNNIGNVDVASLPATAATAANQSTANSSLANIETSVQLLDDAVLADGASASSAKGLVMSGVDGSANAQHVLVDANGHLQVDVLSGGGGGLSSSPTTYSETLNLSSSQVTSTGRDVSASSVIGFMGTSQETTNQILLQASLDDSTYFKVGQAYPSSSDSGAFSFVVDRPPFRYYRVAQTGSSSITSGLVVKASLR